MKIYLLIILISIAFLSGCITESTSSDDTSTKNKSYSGTTDSESNTQDDQEDESDDETSEVQEGQLTDESNDAQDTEDSEVQTEEEPSEIWEAGGVAIKGTYADADIISLDDGTYRMYYSAEPEVENFEGQVYSATSTDGINWVKESGTRKIWATFPSVIPLANGEYRMYFQNAGVIKSALSSDGLTWEDEDGIRIDISNSQGLEFENVAAPTVIYTGDFYLMVYRGTIDERYSQEVPNSNTQLFLWATSEDGIDFEKKGIALDSRNDEFYGLLDGPKLVDWDGVVRLYFWSYKGIYHVEFENNQFTEEAEFDYTTNTNTENKFYENPPGDPTLMKIENKWFMYYGQHTSGIYYATLDTLD